MATGIRASARTRTALAGVAAAVLLLVSATSAFAHTPKVSLTCDAGLKVELKYYSTQDGKTNSVAVAIDDAAVDGSPFTFGSTFTRTWGGLDPYASHTATVAIMAWDDPTGSKGWTKTYTLDLEACKEPSAPPSTPPSNPPPPPPPSNPPSNPPSASPSSSVEAVTGTPRITPPPTDAGVTGSDPGIGFGVIVFGLAAAIALVVAVPARRKATRR